MRPPVADNCAARKLTPECCRDRYLGGFVRVRDKVEAGGLLPDLLSNRAPKAR